MKKNGMNIIFCMNFGTNRIEFECKYKPMHHNILGNYIEIFGIIESTYVI